MIQKFIQVGKLIQVGILFGLLLLAFSCLALAPLVKADTTVPKVTVPYTGMGITIGLDEVKLSDGKHVWPFVVSVLCGSPAHLAEIKSGDRIVKINDTLVIGKPHHYRDALSAIKKGGAGTIVTITFVRAMAQGSVAFKTGRIENTNRVPSC